MVICADFAMLSSKCALNLVCEIVETPLQFVHCTVEGLLRSKAAIGFVGEDVCAFNWLERDSVVKVTVTVRSGANLVEGFFEVHKMVNVGHGLVLSEEFCVDWLTIGSRQSEVKQNIRLLWLVELRCCVGGNRQQQLETTLRALDHGPA